MHKVRDYSIFMIKEEGIGVFPCIDARNMLYDQYDFIADRDITNEW